MTLLAKKRLQGKLRPEEMAGPSTNTPRSGFPVGSFLAPVLIFAVIFLHLYGLEQIPPGIYVDESSIGYNAYSVLQTGADEYGVHFPLYFKAFGEFKNPVFIYSLVPLLHIFGLSVWTIRLGAALFGLGTAVLLGLIAMEGVGGRGAWAAGFILGGLVPWLFTLSRVAFEVISFPFFITLGWWCWHRAIKSNSLPWFLLSWSAWGMSIFTYSTARMMTPVLVLALVVCYFRELGSSRVRCLIGSCPFALSVAFLLSWSVQNPGSLTARFDEISIWKDNPGIFTSMVRFCANYLTYLSPKFLFLRGDPNLRHHTGQGGELFLVTFPLLLPGIIYAWQNRRRALERFALLGFLLFPLAASFTEDPYHALRTANAVPFVILLIIWGFRQSWEWWRGQRALVLLYVAVAVLEIGGFYFDYFSSYPNRARNWFNAGLPQVLKLAFEKKRSDLYYSPLVFRDENFGVNQPYIQFLFFGALDPTLYQEGGLAAFHIYPYRNGLPLSHGSILLLKDAEELFAANSRSLILHSPDLPPSISEPAGQVAVSPGSIPKPPSYLLFRIP